MRLILVVLELVNSTREKNCSFEVLLQLTVVALGQWNTLSLNTWELVHLARDDIFIVVEGHAVPVDIAGCSSPQGKLQAEWKCAPSGERKRQPHR